MSHGHVVLLLRHTTEIVHDCGSESSGVWRLRATPLRQPPRLAADCVAQHCAYGSASTKAITWERFGQTDTFARDLNADGIDLPTLRSLRHVATKQMRLMPTGPNRQALTFTCLGFLLIFNLRFS